MRKAKDKATIFVHGFDAARFITPIEPLKMENCDIRFIGNDAEQSLETADGVIMLSSVFEHFNAGLYDSHTYVPCDKDHLARLRSVIRLASEVALPTAFPPSPSCLHPFQSAAAKHVWNLHRGFFHRFNAKFAVGSKSGQVRPPRGLSHVHR